MMSPEHELKFVFRNGFAREIVSWLEGRCLPDPEYPKGRVNSIYYDLRDHRLLDEKRNSDFLKTKVRLRWYADVHTQAALDPVFLSQIPKGRHAPQNPCSRAIPGPPPRSNGSCLA